MPRSSVYTLLQTLMECGWARTDATGPLYSVEIRALLTGISYLDSDRCVRAVRPHLEEASDALGETIHLAQLDGSKTATCRHGNHTSTCAPTTAWADRRPPTPRRWAKRRPRSAPTTNPHPEKPSTLHNWTVRTRST